MQWKLVTTMQSTSAQKHNNWGMQLTTLGCKHNAKHTQEREREREREREKEDAEKETRDEVHTLVL